jgi:hypothetical protein
MDRISFTLVSEGSSDRALIPHLTWLLEQNGIDIPIESEWADLRFLPERPRGLIEKIRFGFELYPCDLLFVHRDSDRETIGNRKNEIENAISEAFNEESPVYVCVIPVRMLEAWLLFDENAIRRASGNPNGNVRLNLPRLNRIERIANPKNLLYDLLQSASELHGRHLRRLNLSHSISQISQNISDFSPLRELNAFQTLENDIEQVVNLIKNN